MPDRQALLDLEIAARQALLRPAKLPMQFVPTTLPIRLAAAAIDGVIFILPAFAMVFLIVVFEDLFLSPVAGAWAFNAALCLVAALYLLPGALRGRTPGKSLLSLSIEPTPHGVNRSAGAARCRRWLLQCTPLWLVVALAASRVLILTSGHPPHSTTRWERDWVDLLPLLILAVMFLQVIVPIAGRPWYDLLAGTQVFSQTAQASTPHGFEPIFPPAAKPQNRGAHETAAPLRGPAAGGMLDDA
jgi:hypothetical protein